MKAQMLYYTLFQKQKFVHSYSSLPTPSFTSMQTTLDRLPEDDTLDLLEESIVGYSLVNHITGREDLLNNIIPSMIDIDHLHLIKRFEDTDGFPEVVYLFGLAEESQSDGDKVGGSS